MKNILVILSFLCTFSLSAQSVQDIGKIVLGVKVEENATVETRLVSKQLNNKLQQLATQAGYSSYGNNQFYISPNIVINVVDKAEGGMKTIYVVQGELNISVVGGIEKTIYSSILIPFKGSGVSQEKAILNGVLKINYSNIEETFSVAREKILNFYEEKESVIFSRADLYVVNKEYENAIACLMLIPEELTDLYKKALAKAEEIYLKRETEKRRIATEKLNKNNETILRKAQSLLSMQKPEEALRVLWDFRSTNDSQNSLYDSLLVRSEKLINEEKKVELERQKRDYVDNRRREDREWNLYEKTMEHDMKMEERTMDFNYALLESETKIEQQRVEAIKTVACEALRNNPNLLNNQK